MSIQNRKLLKSFFKKGELPSEKSFDDLIDSMINKVDDGLSKTMDDGLMLTPIGTSQKLSSFYKSIEDKNAAWSLDINPGDGTLDYNNHVGDTVLSIHQSGKIGVNTNTPKQSLDVNGVVGMKGRIGTKYTGAVPADGKWHPILKDLNGCHSLEIVAGVGKKKTGRYAMIHGMAMSTFGKSKNKIKVTQAFYGVKSNRIELKWTGTTYKFNLEMRVKKSYEGEYAVKYYMSDLWLDHFMDDSFVGEK